MSQAGAALKGQVAALIRAGTGDLYTTNCALETAFYTRLRDLLDQVGVRPEDPVDRDTLPADVLKTWGALGTAWRDIQQHLDRVRSAAALRKLGEETPPFPPRPSRRQPLQRVRNGVSDVVYGWGLVPAVTVMSWPAVSLSWTWHQVWHGVDPTERFRAGWFGGLLIGPTRYAQEVTDGTKTIVIRIRLWGRSVSPQQLRDWETQAETVWRWPGWTLDVAFTHEDPHAWCLVRQGFGRENMVQLFTSTTPRVFAHEVGHLLGLPDTYREGVRTILLWRPEDPDSIMNGLFKLPRPREWRALARM